MSDSIDFIVNKTDLRQTAFVRGRESASTALDAGQVLLRVGHFAFTANNITYGAIGEMVGYWTFFPTRAGWGRIPVWGFAEVERSTHPGLAVGERIYGYLPMSTYVVVQPERVSAVGFVDASPHRQALPPIYNQYTRVGADPVYKPELEAHLALFRPLFTTAFLLDDFFAESAFFGAQTVVLASASSKTALGLAYLLSKKGHPRCEIVGLTSPANRAFVERTGYYDRVVVYDDIHSQAGEQPTLFVDFSGNADIVRSVHERLAAKLMYSCSVGLTHWDKMTFGAQLPGPAPVLFFAPDRALKRSSDWGASALQERVGEAMLQFVKSSQSWLRIAAGHGQAAVETIYRDALEGRADPSMGHMLSL